MNIRKYKSSDYPAILEIYALSKLDELRFEENQFELLPLEKDQKRFSELIESDIYVYDDRKVIGYGAVYGSEIRSLFVHPNARGRGIGKSLLEYLLSEISGEASLYVAKSNYLTKKLYSVYGFKIVDEFETTYNGISVFANKMLRPVDGS